MTLDEHSVRTLDHELEITRNHLEQELRADVGQRHVAHFVNKC